MRDFYTYSPSYRNSLSRCATSAICAFMLLIACEEEPEEINSIVLAGGAYVQITNRQDLQLPPDTTAITALNGGVFSLELRAAGDTLPGGGGRPPALFMVSNNLGEDELGIYRIPSDSSRIMVYFNNRSVSVIPIPNCDWDDPDCFTQVVVTYDGGTVSVYGNGIFLGSAADATELDIADSHALIGADWDINNNVASLDNFWYGAIDEVRLWTQVLPANEMDFRYKNPKNLTRHYSADGLDNLLGLWRFNNERHEGEEVLDFSGNANHAYIHSGDGSFYFSTSGAE